MTSRIFSERNYRTEARSRKLLRLFVYHIIPGQIDSFLKSPKVKLVSTR
jgi:hypothetical protein